MCGIVGLAITNSFGTNPQFEKFIKVLMVLDQLRGEHSTGLCLVPEHKLGKQEDPVIYKKAMNAMDFLNLGYVKSALSTLKDYQYVFAHNRYATRGGVTNNNAHPFSFGPITMVHNGTINSWGKYTSEANSFSVDSQALTYLFAKHGALEILSVLGGAYALVWHDTRDDTLNIIRNDDRPMFAVRTEFGYAFASEGWMIESAAKYADFKITDPIKEIDTHKLLSLAPSVGTSKTPKTLEYKVKITDWSDQLRPVHTSRWAGHAGNYYHAKTYTPPDNSTRESREKATTTFPISTQQTLVGKTVTLKVLGWEPYIITKKLKDDSYGALYGEVEGHFCGFTCADISKELYDFITEGEELSYKLSGHVSSVYARQPHDSIKKWDYVKSMPFAAINDFKAVGVVEGSKHSADEMIVITQLPRNETAKKGNKSSTVDIQFVPCEGEPETDESPPSTNLVVYTPQEENTDSHNLRYSVPMAGGTSRWIGDFKSWENRAKDGCCYCTAPLVADLINDKNAVITKGNSIVDNSLNFYCESCWLEQNANYSEVAH